MNQAAEVKEKTDIVQIISETVTLKKAGRNYKGLCPFHGEKTPSFMVSPDLQIYKCFGCGEAGDVYSFLQKQHGMDFHESLKYLADKVGIKLETISPQDSGARGEIFEINALAANLYHYLLTRHKLGKEGREYLLDQRGLQKETINTFKLGFAPDKPRILLDYLVQKKGFSKEKVLEAGVVVQTQRGLMDRFRGRAIFPIYDPQSRVVALAGRVLPKFDRGFAKYINSPETPIYHKSHSFYGLSHTKNDIRKLGFAIVVEGELDMLSPWQSGNKNIVASKGTALTAEQMKLISRYCKSIVLALDSDFAGDNAAMRAVSQAQDADLEVKVALMGKYKDPDEFVKADPGGFKKAIDDAVDVWQFVIDYIFDKFDNKRSGGKAKISSEVIPVLASIEDSIVQAHYAQIVSQRLMVPAESVIEQLNKHKQAHTTAAKQALSEISPKTEKTRRQILEEQIVGLALQYDHKKLLDLDIRSIFEANIILKLIDYLEKYTQRQKENFEVSGFIKFLPEEMREGISEMVLAQTTEEQGIDKELDSSIRQLLMLGLRESIELQSHLITKYELEKDKSRLKKAQKELNHLATQLSKLTTKP